jgi:hypothetical protein
MNSVRLAAAVAVMLGTCVPSYAASTRVDAAAASTTSKAVTGQSTWGPTTTVAAARTARGRGLPDSPIVTLSRDGRATTMVWEENDDNPDLGISRTVVRSRSGLVSGTTTRWGTSVVLAAGPNLSVRQLLATDDGTRALVVLERAVGAQAQLQTRTATIAGTAASWGPPAGVGPAAMDLCGSGVALSGDGSRATAVWCRVTGSTGYVESASAVVGAGGAQWGAVQGLATAPSTRVVWMPMSVAASRDGGRVIALWQQGSLGRTVVESRSATVTRSTAAWGRLTRVGSAGGGQSPHVFLSDDGTRATAVWTASPGGSTSVATTSVVLARAATVGRWVPTWGASTAVSAAHELASGVGAAVSATGTRVTVVWTRIFTGVVRGLPRGDVHTRSAVVTGSRMRWGGAAVLYSGLANGAGDVALAASRDGTRATALWVGYTPRASGVVLTRSVQLTGSTARWGATTPVTGQVGYVSRYAVLVSATGTQSLAVWVRDDGTTTALCLRPGLT